MSLHNDINNLSKTIENNAKITEKSLKEQEIKKNNIYIAKIEILDDLKEEMQNYIQDGYNLQDTAVKTEIIELVLSYTNIIYNIQFTRAFILENYNKEAKTIIKEHAKKELEEKKQQQKQLEEVQKKQNEDIKKQILKQKEREQAFKQIIKLIEVIALIILSPLLLLGFFILAICKNVK